jgi:hypothetical protein
MPDRKRSIAAPPPPRQFTLEPGEPGRGDGPLHREPLVKGSPRQAGYGPGTYGNDQFAAAHADDFDDRLEKPEGLQERRPHAARPTQAPKERRYGRIGGQGKG